ncbi:MAG: mannitol dehydrogenase family protein, partial [Silicimonas sp.]|nr:mannitol dehydrogenase family protein [Silicimonas sp.]
GALAKRIIVEFAQAQAPDLAGWIEEHVPFPATMVDRITPATTEADIAALAEDRGYYDPACVVHEPFRQWVIEDDFTGPRPAWERAGAQFVRSVEAHETMKLRCLNGTHSALAYLGYLAGHQTIAEATGDPAFAELCRKLWADEILPTVETPEGEDTAAYCARLLDRYRNPSIRHRTWQIAMDGSQKLPQRILGTISDRLAAGQVPRGLCLVVAGWMRYVGAVDEKGREIDVRDPLAGRLKAAWDQGEDAAGKVNAFLELGEVFERGLAGNAAFRDEVTSALATLLDDGAKSAVEACFA